MSKTLLYTIPNCDESIRLVDNLKFKRRSLLIEILIKVQTIQRLYIILYAAYSFIIIKMK